MATARAPASSSSSRSAARPISAPAASAGWSCRRRPPRRSALDEDAASPFGFKLAGVVSGADRVRPSAGPAGSPASLSVDLGPANPNAGETVRFTFTLPDGSSRGPHAHRHDFGDARPERVRDRRLARPSPRPICRPPSPRRSATLAGTALAAASAVAAGNDFFNIDGANPPQRVDGPPFDTATALVDGTAGEHRDLVHRRSRQRRPRARPRSRGSTSRSPLSYGLRANEEGLRMAVQSIAVFAATTFSGDRSRCGGALRRAASSASPRRSTDCPASRRSPTSRANRGGAQSRCSAAKDRHQQTKSTLQQLLQDVEGAPTEEVAAQILALQTSLQATLQTTAMLLQTNLLEYI